MTDIIRHVITWGLLAYALYMAWDVRRIRRRLKAKLAAAERTQLLDIPEVRRQVNQAVGVYLDDLLKHRVIVPDGNHTADQYRAMILEMVTRDLQAPPP